MKRTQRLAFITCKVILSVAAYRGEIPDLFSYYENSGSSVSKYTISKKSGKGKGILELEFDSDIEDDDEDYVLDSDKGDVEVNEDDEGNGILDQNFDSDSEDDEVYVKDGNDESENDEDIDDDSGEEEDELETSLNQEED
ncbi:unnamed protein product [Ambrosiozyma monospora]|uniref:Unnamed protein product n=1 Tax=Ambrosiozyma monospora TaxID=43982 RepID=A0ACB5TIQ3_AMBMO|nr:unnamed protein product [Ambrosiozyma monospora]